MKKIKIVFFLICLSFTCSLKALDNELLSYQSIYEINSGAHFPRKKTALSMPVGRSGLSENWEAFVPEKKP